MFNHSTAQILAWKSNLQRQENQSTRRRTWESGWASMPSHRGGRHNWWPLHQPDSSSLIVSNCHLELVITLAKISCKLPRKLQSKTQLLILDILTLISTLILMLMFFQNFVLCCEFCSPNSCCSVSNINYSIPIGHMTFNKLCKTTSCMHVLSILHCRILTGCDLFSKRQEY